MSNRKGGMIRNWDYCMGDWRPLVFSIVIGLSILFSLGCFWKGIHNFGEAYEIGYNCAQDDFCNPEDYTEGGFDYWESNSFWIEQGYEEGYKKGARDYVKENDQTGNN